MRKQTLPMYKREKPLEYCGLVLTAIEDIEEIIYRENGNP